MSLESKLFHDDPRLEACLVSDPAHITPGSVGPFVAKIQFALVVMGLGVVSAGEIAAKTYGPSTANAVLDFKRVRRIINTSYQQHADNIVGKMTIAALDKEMAAFEKLPPKPAPPVPPSLEPVSARFAMRAAGVDKVVSEPAEGDPTIKVFLAPPGGFQVFDLTNNRRARYGFRTFRNNAVGISSSSRFPRSPRPFTLKTPLPLGGLECPAVYITAPGRRSSRLELTLFDGTVAGQVVAVPMFIHLAGFFSGPGSDKLQVEEAGQFEFLTFD